MEMEFLIPIASFFAIVALVKVVSDNKIRRQLIEKGMLEENIKNLYPKTFQPLSSLKWGLVLVGIGLALFIGQIFRHSLADEGTMGLMFLFGGLGFLIYYVIAKNHLKDKEV